MEYSFWVACNGSENAKGGRFLCFAADEKPAGSVEMTPDLDSVIDSIAQRPHSLCKLSIRSGKSKKIAHIRDMSYSLF
ncbi:hypothetical protein SAMN05421827_113120 [Pedobacter terrae]|uniref:Uncharacterized protein n=1 Tax=Pedobacter terrae TaxID=405671 RepID=A0A1G7YG62_9SPHI|nr:hypothetical protein SAMN05421827_113120 [Pedobacter terrae]